jgi:hypothetical protein
MIRLGAIDGSIGTLLTDDAEILTTSLPVEKKGEKVVLLFSSKLLDKLKQLIDRSTFNPLMKPSTLIPDEEILKLGRGTSDLTRARQIAIED